MEQEAFLGDDTEATEIAGLAELANVDAVVSDRSARRILETQDQVSERGLAGTARPRQGDDGAARDLERHLLDRRGVSPYRQTTPWSAIAVASLGVSSVPSRRGGTKPESVKRPSPDDSKCDHHRGRPRSRREIHRARSLSL